MSVPSVLTEHRFAVAASPTKQLGEDCTAYGRSDCPSGVCFHYQADPRTGYVCSASCQSVGDCPAGWACNEVVPGSGEAFCAPPSSWVPTATAPQGGAVQ
ncbi:MAG: hypothetical protein ACYCWW_15185 [Deltaproteobacteria bacterium]